MTPDRLHPADLHALADLVAARVVERLREEDAAARAPAGGLVDANEVARRFGVSAQWARQHAGELRAVRLGAGPKARLRFDPAEVEEALTARSEGKRSQMPDRPQRRRKSEVRPVAAAGGCPLLPIRGPGA